MDQIEKLQLAPASVWILQKYIELEKILEESQQNYELAHSIDALYKFLWDYYADWYVEYLKTDDTQISFSKILLRQYIITLSPYSPFETEALWKEFFGETSLLANQIKDKNWSKHVLSSLDSSLESAEEFETVLNFVVSLRSLRGLFAIDPVNLLEIYTQNSTLLNYTNFIKLVGRAELKNEFRSDLYSQNMQGIEYSLDILKYIKNIDLEIQRSEKIVSELQKQILSLESQLNNPKFVENAESSIVEEKKQNLTDRQLEIAQQQTKIQTLKSLTV